ncbi:hypothetical protein M8C21_013887 [Ambrosia artemisiifolia]|uniref:Uncharacterized protein n=1 Tax=Ambrosia artemisiifolia TaxID=4212 RepID=A0AAD5CFN7_AMBAR|nr:hypothetical protein M8C21_013887 [Ambrosia artemisiifolia]
MCSVIDLNHHPDVTFTGDYVTTAGTQNTPKIEPKEEPFDDAITQPHASSQLAVHAGGDDEPDVYSEFNRVSEMFRAAFSGKTGPNRVRSNPKPAGDPDSLAIVSVPEENRHLAVSDPGLQRKQPDPGRRRKQLRSSELVRVTNLGVEDERCFRGVVRKTRMIYDSLRVFVSTEDEKRRNSNSNSNGNNNSNSTSDSNSNDINGNININSNSNSNSNSNNLSGRNPHARGHLKSASVMKDRGLWLHRDKRIVGAIPGVYVGDIFFFRMEICVVGMHGLPQAGIDYLSSSQSSNGEPIATSIIVSGGYEDDQDAGDVIIYTGHGGQDKFSRQADHQRLEGGNLAMERSMCYGLEVRVVRGFRYEGSPSGKVYVYDGLYKVVDSWLEAGKSGFGVIKFKLVRMENQPEMGSAILKYAASLRKGPLQVMPGGYVSMDMSMKKEHVPVFLFNDIDDNHEPMFYEYLVTSVFPPFVYHHGAVGGGCDCVSGCIDGCFCAKRNGGDFAYDQNGLLVRGKPLIFECGPHCSCPPNCRNRVSQNGVKNKFEVFRSHETGWGVRSLDLIQAGSFICEYTGVILTRQQAQLFSMNGDNLIYPNRFGERWAEWGDLSQVFSDYERPSYPSVPPLDFAMDVSRMRNVACYLSHSLCPNVLVQLVLYDHSNYGFPHLMLFAMENIPPMRELSLDYGEADEWTGKLSICN